MNIETIVIPMGDPAGVGPEIIAKSLAKEEVQHSANLLVIGDKNIMDQAIDLVGVDLEIRSVLKPSEGNYRPGVLNLMDLNNVDMESFRYGEISANCGRASYEYIAHATELCMTGEVIAMATTPINKESFAAAGIPYIGHTGVLEALTGVHDPLTMFQVQDLRVFFYSKHVSLRQACDLISKEGIISYTMRSLEALRRMGVKDPSLAVAGLNPHNGEHGLFGSEEVEFIIPAIDEMRERGVRVYGPIGADSVFQQALEGRYDGVLSLYHDQGHIATKMVDFYRTISFTHNMPFLRTSVDHGTAFDIAGKNIVSETSLDSAILLAARYAPHFRK
ncbi:MAG: 4-hydroxythreonine-4-phosphate dehydrogenase PdxA [Tissierellia bacterium]|nr:4-hydroxythreonine-4-phosphate dehydrogenase PdxA [Tissierellia bacterium]